MAQAQREGCHLDVPGESEPAPDQGKQQADHQPWEELPLIGPGQSSDRTSRGILIEIEAGQQIGMAIWLMAQNQRSPAQRACRRAS